jgi:hypothetical protein
MKSHVLTEYVMTLALKCKQTPKNLCASWLFKVECQKPLLTGKQDFSELWSYKDTAIQASFSPHGEARSWMVMQVVYTVSNQSIS